MVGVQPFGGEGLPGTGARKTGGPLYLLCLFAERPPVAAPPRWPGRRWNVRRCGGRTATRSVRDEDLAALRDWALTQGCNELAAHAGRCEWPVGPVDCLAVARTHGEADLYTVLRPREAVPGLVDDESMPTA